MKKWEPLHSTLDDSKSEERQGDYPDKTQNVLDNEIYQIWISISCGLDIMPNGFKIQFFPIENSFSLYSVDWQILKIQGN